MVAVEDAFLIDFGRIGWIELQINVSYPLVMMRWNMTFLYSSVANTYQNWEILRAGSMSPVLVYDFKNNVESVNSMWLWKLLK